VNNHEKCLIVDDSRVVRKVASGIISKLGFAVAEAEDGEKAYNYCTQQMPNLFCSIVYAGT